MNEESNASQQQLSDIRYYLMWATRRRRPFLQGSVLDRTVELLSEAAIALGARVTDVGAGGDYLIVTVESPPDLSPWMLVGRLKRYSASQLRREFEELRRQPSVWTRQFLATTRDDFPSSRIETFVEEQPRSERRRFPRPGEQDTAQLRGSEAGGVRVRRLPPPAGEAPAPVED